MLHRIRLAMQNGSIEKMQGTVEADETFIGGKSKNMHKDKKAKRIQGRGMVGKEIVLGILERGERNSYHAKKHKIGKHSKVRVKHIPDTTGETLQAEVKGLCKNKFTLSSPALAESTGGLRILRDFLLEKCELILAQVLKANVIPGSEVFTDAALGYRGLRPEFVHAFIDHAITSAEGQVHTNGTENFWTLFKRYINGT